jgi:hypothetical protein
MFPSHTVTETETWTPTQDGAWSIQPEICSALRVAGLGPGCGPRVIVGPARTQAELWARPGTRPSHRHRPGLGRTVITVREP